MKTTCRTRPIASAFCRSLCYCIACVLLLGGCKQESSKPPQQTDQQPTTVVLKPADDQDQTELTLLFPPSDKIGDWIKTGPVTGGGADNLKNCPGIPADLLGSFGTEFCATAVYERIVDGHKQRLDVALIRAQTTDDAYGILTVLCPGKDTGRFGDVCRSVAPAQLHVVKGNFYVQFRGSIVDRPDAQTPNDLAGMNKDIELFAGKMIFKPLGRGGPPLTVQVLMVESQIPSQVFFVRSLSALAGPVGNKLLDSINLANPAAMDRLLGLSDGQASLAIAVYKLPNWPGKNVVWLATYRDAQQAQEVFLKYDKVIHQRSEQSALHMNTLLKPTDDKYLLGCWTAETESLDQARMLQKIYPRLP